MEDQNLTQNNSPVPAPNNPEVLQTTPAQPGSKSLMYLATALVLIAVIVLVGAGYLYFSHSDKGVLGNSAKNNNIYSVKISQAPARVTSQTVKPVTVTNTKDLEKLLNELNTASNASIESDYNQAVAESSNL